jgi:hypothetical protein
VLVKQTGVRDEGGRDEGGRGLFHLFHPHCLTIQSETNRESVSEVSDLRLGRAAPTWDRRTRSMASRYWVGVSYLPRDG